MFISRPAKCVATGKIAVNQWCKLVIIDFKTANNFWCTLKVSHSISHDARLGEELWKELTVMEKLGHTM